MAAKSRRRSASSASARSPSADADNADAAANDMAAAVLLRHTRLDSQSDAPLSLSPLICAPLLNLAGSRARPLRWVGVAGLFGWLHFLLLIWCSAPPMPASGMLNRGTGEML